MTMSTPNISSSGNIRPQSTTTKSSLVSIDGHVAADFAAAAERNDADVGLVRGGGDDQGVGIQMRRALSARRLRA